MGSQRWKNIFFTAVNEYLQMWEHGFSSSQLMGHICCRVSNLQAEGTTFDIIITAIKAVYPK